MVGAPAPLRRLRPRRVLRQLPGPARDRALHERRAPGRAELRAGEDWFWDYEKATGVLGPQLAAPTSRPEDQPVPGPAGSVPPNWRSQLH